MSSRTAAPQSSDERHLAQRTGLIDFVDEHRELLEEYMPYRVWTSASTAVPLDITPSKLLPDLLGVLPGIRTISKGGFLSGYAGALMWRDLHEKFTARWHCPTAVDVDVLDFYVDTTKATRMGLLEEYRCRDDRDKWIVKMVLVGDPIVVGSLFNAAHGLNVKPNARLASCTAGQLAAYTTVQEDSKLEVSGDLVHVEWDLPKATFSHTQLPEILVSYGSNFWNRLDEEPYCEVCYSKECSNDRYNDPMRLFLCSFNNPPCSHGARHLKCFPLGDFSYSASDWYCLQHRQNKLGAPSRSIAVAVGGWTPPPTIQSKPAARRSYATVAVAGWTPPSDNLPSSCAAAAAAPSSRLIRRASLLPQLTSSATSTIPRPRSEQDSVGQRPLRDEDYGKDLDISDDEFDEVNSSIVAADDHGFDDEGTDGDVSSDTSDSESDEDLSNDDSDDSCNDMSLSAQSAPAAHGSRRLTTASGFTVSGVASGRRMQSLPPPSKKVKMTKKRRMPLTELSKAGHQLLRTVWQEFLPSIDAAALRKKKAAPTWPNRVDMEADPSHKEIRLHRDLQADYDFIRACCGTPLKVEAKNRLLPEANRVEFFDSAANLLRSRLLHFQQHRWDKASRKKEVETHLAGIATDFNWRESMPLCLECYSCALGRGFSRGSMFRLRSSIGGEIVPTTRACQKRQEIAEYLLRWARSEGQSDPAGEQSFHSKTKALLDVIIVPSMSTVDALARMTTWILTHDGLKVDIKMSTFYRARKFLAEHHNIIIRMKKSKSVARCNDCERIHNKIRKWKVARNETKINLYTEQMKIHNDHWQQQRKHWDKMKQEALRTPWNTQSWSMDGFDMSKTRYPHYVRPSKQIDEVRKCMLKMRTIGFICIGAVRPVVGITANEDVKDKGGACAVTQLDMVMDLQWKKQNTKVWATIPNEPFNMDYVPEDVATVHATDDVDPKKLKPFDAEAHWRDAERGLDVDEERKDSWTEHSGGEGTIPFMHPKRLHLTFDNTGADNKNAQFFHYLACLVGAGVYEEITVTNLLIGHTHDIVDQMFSIWAVKLRTTDAPTLKAMHKLFREKFASKIYALAELIQAEKKRDAQREKESRQNDPAAGDFDTHSTTSSRTRKDDQTDELPAIASYLLDIAKDLGVQPELIHQTLTVDAAAWSPFKKIDQISRPHCFYIRCEDIPAPKAKAGEPSPPPDRKVVMYTKWLANSIADCEEVNHRHRDLPYGGWTDDITLIASVNRQLPLHDPICMPLRDIPGADTLRKAIPLLQAEDNMTDAQAAELIEQLDGFQSKQALQQATCLTCHQHALALVAIGPISAKTKKMTDAEKKFIDSQKAKKAALEKQQVAHIASGVHSKLENWWTKWLRRVRDTIRPYYLARGITVDRTVRLPAEELGRSHPALPADKGRPSILPAVLENVSDRLDNNGPPKVGDFVATRGKLAYNPVGLAKITAIIWAAPEDWRSYVDSDKPPARARKPAIDAAAASSGRGALGLENHEDNIVMEDVEEKGGDSDDDDPPAAAAASSFAAAAAAASSSTGPGPMRVTRGRAGGATSTTPAHVAVTSTSESKEDAEMRAASEEDDELDESDDRHDDDDGYDDKQSTWSLSEPDLSSEDEDEDEDESYDGASQQPKGKKRPRGSSAKSPAAKKPKVSASQRSPAAAAAASSSDDVDEAVESEEAPTLHRWTDDGKLEVMHVVVEWWDYTQTASNTKLQLENEATWDKAYADAYVGLPIDEENAPLADRQAEDKRRKAYLDVWKKCKAAFGKGEFVQLPSMIVNRLRDVVYRRNPDWADSTLEVATLILWGSRIVKTANAGSSSRKFDKLAFDRIVEDLTEKPAEKRRRPAAGASDGAAVAAAAASANSATKAGKNSKAPPAAQPKSKATTTKKKKTASPAAGKKSASPAVGNKGGRKK